MVTRVSTVVAATIGIIASGDSMMAAIGGYVNRSLGPAMVGGRRPYRLPPPSHTRAPMR